MKGREGSLCCLPPTPSQVLPVLCGEVGMETWDISDIMTHLGRCGKKGDLTPPPLAFSQVTGRSFSLGRREVLGILTQGHQEHWRRQHARPTWVKISKHSRPPGWSSTHLRNPPLAYTAMHRLESKCLHALTASAQPCLSQRHCGVIEVCLLPPVLLRGPTSNTLPPPTLNLT